ncbi:hypothetical protein HAX54_030733 [Datura stramonium]|uniref:Uncharacterized protein n=1 Tax=Datura stramonium TaxID=4076 RepID=A0ABS8V844_DATST|nr:hypothetical protein [Datura stramonium]
MAGAELVGVLVAGGDVNGEFFLDLDRKSIESSERRDVKKRKKARVRDLAAQDTNHNTLGEVLPTSSKNVDRRIDQAEHIFLIADDDNDTICIYTSHPSRSLDISIVVVSGDDQLPSDDDVT